MNVINFEQLKNGKNKRIAYIFGGVILLILFVILLSPSKETESADIKQTTNVSIEPTVSVYTSKKEAYDDVIRNPEHDRTTSNFSIYDQMIEERAQKEQQKNSPTLSALERLQESSQNVSTTTAELAQTTSYSEKSTPITDDSEYQNIASQIDRIYNRSTTSTTTQNNQDLPALSLKEQKKQALEKSWAQTNNVSTNTMVGSIFKGVVHKTQSVQAGEVATFRLSEDLKYNGYVIPENTILFGTISGINENRVKVTINSATINNNIIHIPITVYGTDGIEGIPVIVNETTRTIDSETKDEIISQAGSTAGRLGTIGRAIGNIVSSAARSTKREKEHTVILIDNQRIYLKL